MAAIDGLLTRLGLATASQVTEVKEQAARAYEAGFSDGNDEPPAGTLASYGYKRKTAKGLRDFTQLTHDQIINTVWTLYQSNGIAKRGLVMQRDHILGRNTKLVAEDDPALQVILDDFWKANKFGKRLKQFVISRSLFGELCLPVFVRRTDGRVKLGYIDSADIDHVVTHPRNQLEQWVVVCKERDGRRDIYRIIREDEGYARGDTVTLPAIPDKLVTHDQATLEPWEGAFLQANGLAMYTGSCFYFDKNNVANQPRGFSDLLQSADPLDQHDETLFALGEREALAAYFSWDVGIDGPPDVVETRASELRKRPPVGRGQINAHNLSEVWDFVHPDLKQPGTIATANALKTQVLEGMNQPRHWHGEDDTANRATAEAADNPANKSLEHEQADLEAVIIEMGNFVRDQAEIAGQWKPVTTGDGQMTGTLDVLMPEISTRDIAKVSAALAQVIQAVAVARFDLEVITQETAGRAVAKVFAELGIEYNPDDELEAIGSQATDPVDQAEDVAITEFARLNGNT